MTDFADTYPEARARFLDAVHAFEAYTGRTCTLERHVLFEAEDLGIDVAHFEAREGRRLYLATSGVHGIEGYAGSAIQRALLEGPLRRLPRDCGVALVHAVNPWGMAHRRRVNAENVDLNRNFALEGDALYATESSGYRLIASALSPDEPCRGGLGPKAQLLGSLFSQVLRAGYPALKQALLQGQYRWPEGLFFGGTAPQRETLTFEKIFEPLCERYDEILLTDLHTGYGARGQVQLLSPDTDGEAIRSAQGYTVTGDLVGWCRHTASRVNPDGRCYGAVIELGTTGYSLRSQLRDLETMMRENQLHRHGALGETIEQAVNSSFRELFWPADPAWRRETLSAAVAAIEALLARRGYMRQA